MEGNFTLMMDLSYMGIFFPAGEGQGSRRGSPEQESQRGECGAVKSSVPELTVPSEVEN